MVDLFCLCFLFRFGQQRTVLRQLPIEVAAKNVQHLDQGGVAQRVEDLIADLPVHQHLFASQHGEVLRGIGLLEAQFFHELPGRELPVPEGLYNRNPSRMRQGLEDLSFEAAEGVWHTSIIFEYANVMSSPIILVGTNVTWLLRLVRGRHQARKSSEIGATEDLSAARMKRANYQTLQIFSLTIGWPALQAKASRNCGMFTTTPLMRNSPGE